MNFCQKCGRTILMPEGPIGAPILLVGDAPTAYDIKEGQLWTGPGGEILRMELRNAGISMKKDCRITNMWLHAKTKQCSEHLDELYAEMKGRKAVLLMGAEAVSHFTGENVSDVSSLRVDTLPKAQEMLPKGPIVYAIFNPAIALHDKLGEIRLGMERFGEAINGR